VAPMLEALRCSFCAKRGTQVRSLVCGRNPKVAICDERIELRGEIIT